MEEVAVKLIFHSGNARSYGMEAIKEAREENFDLAKDLLLKAKDELKNAQRSHSGIIQDEAAGKAVEVSLLLVHAEDHLSASTIIVDLANEIIEIHKKYSK